jgi:hypothetical protein
MKPLGIHDVFYDIPEKKWYFKRAIIVVKYIAAIGKE